MAKQNIDKDATLDLLNKVNRFAEIFWDSKISKLLNQKLYMAFYDLK